MALIDREDLLAESRKSFCSIYQLIKEMPAVDAEPVRHGRWIDPEDPVCYKCSVCGRAANQPYGYNVLFYARCPHCGAKMDKED